MSLTTKKIRAEIAKQKEIEGFTPESGLLLKLLPLVKSSRDWQALTVCKFHRYGKHSYASHRFWYPSPLLLELQGFFTENSQED